METKFCQYCGVNIPADSRFCSTCGKAQSSLNDTVVDDGPNSHFGLQMAKPKKYSNKRNFIVAGGALVVALLVVLFVVKPFDSVSLAGKPASVVLNQLVEDGFCEVPDTREGFSDFESLLTMYDEDTFRGCTKAKNGNYFFIYANLTPEGLAEELNTSSNTQNVWGNNWVLEFTGSNNDAVIAEIASKYGGFVV